MPGGMAGACSSEFVALALARSGTVLARLSILGLPFTCFALLLFCLFCPFVFLGCFRISLAAFKPVGGQLVVRPAKPNGS